MGFRLLQANFFWLLGCRRRFFLGFRLPQAKKFGFFRKIWIFKFEIIKPREPTFDRKFEIIKPRIWDLADSDTKGGAFIINRTVGGGVGDLVRIGDSMITCFSGILGFWGILLLLVLRNFPARISGILRDSKNTKDSQGFLKNTKDSQGFLSGILLWTNYLLFSRIPGIL